MSRVRITNESYRMPWILHLAYPETSLIGIKEFSVYSAESDPLEDEFHIDFPTLSATAILLLQEAGLPVSEDYDATHESKPCLTIWHTAYTVSSRKIVIGSYGGMCQRARLSRDCTREVIATTYLTKEFSYVSISQKVMENCEDLTQAITEDFIKDWRSVRKNPTPHLN